MVGGTDINQLKMAAEEMVATVVMATATETATATATERVTETATTPMPTPMLMLTPMTVHWQQQRGWHTRRVHCSNRPHHCLGLPPPTAAAIATAAIFVKDADAPANKGTHEESAVREPEEVLFVIIAE
jgi:hypothetical protein